jgi:hypothetical protein
MLGGKKLFYWCYLTFGSPTDFYKGELPAIKRDRKRDTQLGIDVVHFTRTRSRSLGGMVQVSTEVPVRVSPYDGVNYEEQMWATLSDNWVNDEAKLDLGRMPSQGLQDFLVRRLKHAPPIPLVNEVKEEFELPLSLKVLWDLRGVDLLNKHTNLATINRIGGWKDKRTLWSEAWGLTSEILTNASIDRLEQ